MYDINLTAGIVVVLAILALSIVAFNAKSIPRKGRTEVASLLVLIAILIAVQTITESVMVGEISAVAGLGLMFYTYHVFVNQKPTLHKERLAQKDYLTVMGYVLIHLWVDGKFGLNGYELSDLRKMLRKPNIFRRKWDEMLADSVMADTNVDRAKFLNKNTRKEYFSQVKICLKKD